MKKLPKKLGNDTIVDAIIEIRFETLFDKNAIFGYIYSMIMNDYKGNVINLPESQLPAAIREADPNLRFKPLHRIEGEKTIIQIGSNVIAISSKIPYIGWDEFSSIFFKIVTKINSQDPTVLNKVIRLGIRYVDFFKGDISEKINMTFKMCENYEHTEDLYIRTTLKDKGFINIVQFSNSANFHGKDQQTIEKGSLIDIDTSKEYSDSSFLGNIHTEIDNAHSCQKSLFFSTLKDDLINTLNPIF